MDRIFAFGRFWKNTPKIFVSGGYAAVGWFSDQDFSSAASRDDLEDIHATVSPGDARNVLKGPAARSSGEIFV